MIQHFLQYLQYEKNFSPHTVSAYRTDLSQFCRHMNIDKDNFPYEDITSANIQHWIISLIEHNISSRSISRKISSLKSFWHFLQLQGLTKKNPTSILILPKTKKPLPVFYKEKEMAVALAPPPLKKDFTAIRNLLIIDILYETGLRVSELTSLRNQDLDLKNETLKVLGKRNKERIIPIGKKLTERIIEYITSRDRNIDKSNNFFLVKENGSPMYREAIYNIVHSQMSNISTLHKQSPHVLRHTFATSLLNNGADINAVKKLMGHQSLAATQVYTHVSFNELNKIYKQAHPRAKKRR